MVLDACRGDSCSHATPQATKPDVSNTTEETDFIHSEEFLHGLMKRQLKLSISCAAAFLLLLFGLPLLNYLAPEFMAQRVGGFTLTWLMLGVLFFPYVWIIARCSSPARSPWRTTRSDHAAEGNKRQS